MIIKCGAIFVLFILVVNDGIKNTICLAKYVDLTHPFKNGDTRTWPINKDFKLTIGTRGLVDLGGPTKVYLENNEFFMVNYLV